MSSRSSSSSLSLDSSTTFWCPVSREAICFNKTLHRDTVASSPYAAHMLHRSDCYIRSLTLRRIPVPRAEGLGIATPSVVAICRCYNKGSDSLPNELVYVRKGCETPIAFRKNEMSCDVKLFYGK